MYNSIIEFIEKDTFLSGYTGHKDDGDPQTVRKCTVMC